MFYSMFSYFFVGFFVLNGSVKYVYLLFFGIIFGFLFVR